MFPDATRPAPVKPSHFAFDCKTLLGKRQYALKETPHGPGDRIPNAHDVVIRVEHMVVAPECGPPFALDVDRGRRGTLPWCIC